MNKNSSILKQALRLLALLVVVSGSALSALAQSVRAYGVVVDVEGSPLPGVTVRVTDKTGQGTITDMDGNFSIQVEKSDRLTFTYVGFVDQTIAVADQTFPLRLVLHEDSELLDEVVVIGYGSVQKKDLTGSITTISSKDFQKGAIATPDQLITGKIAGVQIVPGGGAPGSGAMIRIRGGASLNASNNPLIVIDGVPMEGSTLPGAPSPLSSINPADIESMNVLKDASATAIYGSRASNGVIIITTKKGSLGQPIRVQASTRFSVSTPRKYVDVYTGDEIRAIVKKSGEQKYIDMLGKENTDWQKAIYQTALGTDNNVSISGATSWLPYRVSVGYYDEKGILKTDHMQRVTGDLSLTPHFLNDDLTVTLNVKGSYTRNRYADKGAIDGAVRMDPTQPIMSNEAIYKPFGGYWFLTGTNDKGQVIPRSLAPRNPLALLMEKDDRGTSGRIIANSMITYKLPFVKGLSMNLNLAYDYGVGQGRTYIPVNAPLNEYTNQNVVGKGGLDKKYRQEKTNKLLDFYVNYKHESKAILGSLDLMAGYSYQDWMTKDYKYSEKTAGGIEYNKPVFPYDLPRNTLVSFYGRVNYSLLDRYLFTATVRADGSSRFAPKYRWGVFPSLALAWKIKEESFLKEVDAISDLKLRLGYGMTGQQDGIANYSYQSVYSLSDNQHKYLFGDKWYNMYKPAAYDAEIKWEQTATSNIGLDYGFLKGRLYGSIDLYVKHTKDLLNTIPVPAGANFSNRLLTNIGSMTNRGAELSVNYIPIETKDWNWVLNFNATYNQTKITQLTQVEDPTYLGAEVGGISGGTGQNVQIHSVGYEPYSFFVYKQVYDAKGKPIEGVFADLNGDGKIDNYDKYHCGKPAPDFLFGLSTSLRYKGLTLSTSLRANTGHKIYDNVSSDNGTLTSIKNPLGWISNATHDYSASGFVNYHYLSDYYVRDASFLKMDNLTLSYDFGRLFHDTVGINLGATVQNVFTLTSYKGIDPEVSGGIDHQFYPIPRTYSLSLGLTF
ncbi:TonB-dependent receptor [Porphyromonas sp. HMSC065F10]|uniref:SusC/RagA family TonB-linked outer membrane protein n=1 Tax=Porphyromonas sp. HMSC065F10 TaxID=1739394 RepID=UPI0008A388D2|nr:TonB-dependent receptor [Porphyromonas sp. HMSC065F10]OFR36074.1 SusC/RagA family TonB-linked outer membrane protein [Porphyromonas sp. HMSC065F10]